MKINRIKLSPFAGVSDKELLFQDGMNVIVGENEKGKSTILNAILKLLFVRTDLTASKFKRQFDKFIPIGGDFSYSEIDFTIAEKNYSLKKKWGANKFSELTLDDNTKIGDEDTIEDKLNQIIPFNEATFTKVLLTQQNSLSKTIDELESQENTSVKNDFNNLLRSSIINAGDVSVDEFQNILNFEYDKIWGRWDIENSRPEGNRGIENPWRQGVGLVLEAYYNLEEKKKELSNLLEIEERYEILLKEESELNSRVERYNKYLAENKEIVSDARKRTTLESKLALSQSKIKDLKEISNKWPVIESKIEEKPELINAINGELKYLYKERDGRKIIDENKNLLDRYARLSKLLSTQNDAKRLLDSSVKITDLQIEEVEKIKNDLELTKTQIEASSLSISIFAKQNTHFIAQLGIKLQENVDLKKDEIWENNTEGGFRFETDEVKVSVTPGESDFEFLKNKYEKLKSDYQRVFDEFNVKSYEELRIAYNKYKSLLNDFQNAENNYLQELGEDSYEEITKRAENLNTNKNNAEVRLLEPIIVDITKKENILQQHQNEKESLEGELKKLIDEYESKDNIILILVEESKLTKDLESEIKLLKNIPQDYSNAEEFINAYEQKLQERDEIKDELSEIKISISGLEPQLSETSSTELYEIISKKDEEFKQNIKTGLALKKIMEKTHVLKETIDKNIYDSYQKDLLSHIAELSGDKYKNAKIEESIPKALINNSGKEISNELLSAGTKDILGLSVHLAMVKYYLDGKDGFVGIDDPLVDLDPVRQKAASSLLINLAKDKQAIIFTCHPTHADQLGGNRIEL